MTISNPPGSISFFPPGRTISFPSQGTITISGDQSLIDLFAGGYEGFLGVPFTPLETVGGVPADDAGDPVGELVGIAPGDAFNFSALTTARPGYSLVPPVGMFNMLAFGGAASESFASWTKIRSTATDNASGILASLAPDTSTNTHILAALAPINTTSGVAYTFFAVLKKGVASWIQMSTFTSGFDAANVYANFNLDSGAVGNAGSGATTEIRAVPASLTSLYPELAGGYICRMTATSNGTSTSADFRLYHVDPSSPDPASRGPSFTGVATNTILCSRAAVAYGSRDIDWYIANYQKVTSRYNVSQAGLPQIECLGSDGGDHMTSGVDAFGAATQGLYAATGENWATTIAVSTFGTGVVQAQTDTATAGDQMFNFLVGSAGDPLLRLRGTENDLGAAINNGAWNVFTFSCSNGVVTSYWNRSAGTTPTVGAGSAEVTNLRLMARTAAGTPGNILTGGYVIPSDIIDRAYSAAEAAQVQAYWCNRLQIP